MVVKEYALLSKCSLHSQSMSRLCSDVNLNLKRWKPQRQCETNLSKMQVERRSEKMSLYFSSAMRSTCNLLLRHRRKRCKKKKTFSIRSRSLDRTFNFMSVITMRLFLTLLTDWLFFSWKSDVMPPSPHLIFAGECTSEDDENYCADCV